MADPVSLAAISGTLELVNKSVDLVRNLRKKGDDELTAAEMRITLIDLLDDLLEVKSEFVSLKAVLLSKEEEIQELKLKLEGKFNLTLLLYQLLSRERMSMAFIFTMLAWAKGMLKILNIFSMAEKLKVVIQMP